MARNYRNLSVLIKPVSARCNLSCRYCFYMDESRSRQVPVFEPMKSETVNKIIERIVEYLNGQGNVTVSFQGGEPTLAGLGFYKEFVEKLNAFSDIKASYSIQTNGTLLNDDWIEFFKENHFLVGVSLDGPKELNDQFRLFINNDGSYDAVFRNIEKLKKAEVEFNILTVVTRQLSAHPKELMVFYVNNEIEYVQLIPCLPPLNDKNDTVSMTPKLYKTFFSGFFTYWKKAYMEGNIVHVNTFENLAFMLNGYAPPQCGLTGMCTLQYVIEANGNVYPCDFYCLDEDRIGSVSDDSFEEMALYRGKRFLQKQKAYNDKCLSCRYGRICKGGCRRQNVCYLEDDYCGHEDLLECIIPQITELMSRG